MPGPTRCSARLALALAVVAAVQTGCLGACELVEEPASALVTDIAAGRVAQLREECGVAGQTAEGNAIVGRITWEHDTSEVTVVSWQSRDRRIACDPAAQTWLRTRLVFTVDDQVLLHAEGRSHLRDDGAVDLLTDEVTWRSPDNLPDRVANALWESPRLLVAATLRDRPSTESCVLRLSVAGEGEIHGIDVSGTREVLSASN